MWQQNYTPIGDSLGLSALVAAIPLIVILFLLAVAKKASWVAALFGCGTAFLVAVLAYGMPLSAAISSILYGIAYGFLPIGWIVFTAVLLYKLSVETGNFEVIKDSIASLTGDQAHHDRAVVILATLGSEYQRHDLFGASYALAIREVVDRRPPAGLALTKVDWNLV